MIKPEKDRIEIYSNTNTTYLKIILGIFLVGFALLVLIGLKDRMWICYAIALIILLVSLVILKLIKNTEKQKLEAVITSKELKCYAKNGEMIFDLAKVRNFTWDKFNRDFNTLYINYTDENNKNKTALFWITGCSSMLFSAICNEILKGKFDFREYKSKYENEQERKLNNPKDTEMDPESTERTTKRRKMLKKLIIRLALGILFIIIVVVFMTWIVLKNTRETKIPNEYSCEIEKETFNDRAVYVISPKEVSESELTIIYFHGGSYVGEINNEHWNFVEKIISDTGATVIMPDYPLAPEYNYMDVFNMVEPLYKEIIKKVDAQNLIMMGDSAGGGIALALDEKLSSENVELPNKTILISPWLDVRLTNPEIANVQEYDKQLDVKTLRLAGFAYAEKAGLYDYLVNPIDGDLSKLKNITIYTGTYDILNPDVHVLEERAKEQGTNIEVKEYKGKEHIWILKEYGEGYEDLIESLER